MIHKYPSRFLIGLAVLAAIFFALGGPGRNDKSGAWMYISGVSFIAFLLTVVSLVIVAVVIVAGRRRTSRARHDV